MNDKKAPTIEISDSLSLPMIAQDGGNPEAGRFRIGLAMVITMLAEQAKEHPLPAQVLNTIAANIIEGNEQGVSFVQAHVGRMMQIRIVPMEEKPSE